MPDPPSSGSEADVSAVPRSSSKPEIQSLSQLGESPAPMTLVRWFETLRHVQRAAIVSNEFLAETASAVVELIGLDHGLVLLRNRLTDCVLKHQGVVVDYYGDGLCALWNAPLQQSDHADQACQAALDMHGALPSLDREWRPIIGRSIHLGIGIHTGVALIGNAGCRQRIKYGPHGHCVNLASRVEGVTKHFQLPI